MRSPLDLTAFLFAALLAGALLLPAPPRANAEEEAGGAAPRSTPAAEGEKSPAPAAAEADDARGNGAQGEPPAPQTAEDDDLARLGARFAALAARLEDLRARLDALEKAMDREEAGALEARRQRAARKPKPKPAPESEPAAEATEEPAEPDGEASPEAADETMPVEEEDPEAAAIREVAGTYEVDRDAFFEGLRNMLREQFEAEDIPAEFLETLLAQLESEMGDFSLTFVLETDLTWKATGTARGEESTASGTWSRDGERVTLEQTHADGEPADDPQTLEGTWADGVLRLKPVAKEDAFIPFEIVLNKVSDQDR